MKSKKPLDSKIESFDGSDWSPFHFGKTYWLEKVSDGQSRLVIGCSENCIEILCKLISQYAEPFGLLYVLVAPRRGHKRGRYQSPEPTSLQETIGFLKACQDYFELDGRHNLWIFSFPTDTNFVYDNHNLIYVYGLLDPCMAVLEDLGFSQRGEQIPVPHAHQFKEAFDSDEDRIFELWDWTWFEIVEDVDDP